jgi:Rrf2 family protein
VITQTSELAIQVLFYLASQPGTEPVPPTAIAEQIGASPSYAAKVCNSLARAGILRTTRGAKGGVRLAADPQELSLLSIVEAVQGKVLANYCSEGYSLKHVCNWHRAMDELHKATTGILAKWTLGELLRCPHPTGSLGSDTHCRVAKHEFDWLKRIQPGSKRS